MIDSHTHIFDKAFDGDREAVIQRAAAEGVERMILPAIDSASHGALIECLDKYPSVCFGAIGLHPTSVNDNPAWEKELELVVSFLECHSGRWVAIGEVGLDLYWSKDFLKEQQHAFVKQIELALAKNLPLIIHTRDAWDEMITLTEPYIRDMRAVFHSFSGQEHHLSKILQYDNIYIGMGGVVTYNKSALPELLKDVPLERILLETDAPYLPPVPYRGKRNESSYLPLIAAKIAEIKGEDVNLIKKITAQNTVELFFS